VLYGLGLTILFEHVFAANYRAAKEFVLLLTTAYALNAIYRTVAGFIFYSRRTIYIAAVTMTCGLASLLISWRFVAAYGLIGAAWASVASNCLLMTVTWAVSARIFPMPYWPVLRSLVRGADQAVTRSCQASGIQCAE
jgi:O-antigen/teichoic acid export membrane protein